MSASESSPTAHTGIPPWVVVVALSMLLGLQPVTTDLYLPALPQMQRALGLSPSMAQWTLSVLILCFGFGQLAWGPVADRIGRRPVLRWGLSLYVMASVAATLADTFWVMIAARAVQGAALSAAVMCGRAMVRDLYAPEDGARMMAQGMSGLGIIALVGPILGGLAATFSGWRAAMSLMALAGSIILVFVWLHLPETLPTERRQRDLHWRTLLRNWWSIARHPTFRAHAMLTSSTYGGLYAYLALSAFVFIDVLGVARTVYGLVMACLSMSYLAGTYYCRHHISRRGLIGTVRIAGWVSLSGGLWLASLSALQLSLGWAIAPWALMPGMLLYSFAHGIHQPCGQTGVVAAFPNQAGAASALSGFVLSVVAFSVGIILSWWTSLPGWAGTIHPMTLWMALGGAITARVALHRVQRDGLVKATA
jgi:DHA1 family bicyclomycin/chloramphenicol resistance-like MFS transporter